jgi:hypothetical protein
MFLSLSQQTNTLQFYKVKQVEAFLEKSKQNYIKNCFSLSLLSAKCYIFYLYIVCKENHKRDL